MGKRDGGTCDLYWNSVHFTEAEDVIAGKVNKFPGMYLNLLNTKNVLSIFLTH